ncbi:hypothetical protein NKI36_30565 [Mesorhizobium caraganae]|uniref:Uncharacterized protein n=1 Tax=Mesorhizobium caraganae TaxID=483206 RepID=A0ABV1ZAJ0_9HYPH
MAKPRLETLKSINAEFLGRQCIDEDLEQLVTLPFGAVSSFESVLSDLRRIVARTLGHVAPDAVAQASDPGHD